MPPSESQPSGVTRRGALAGLTGVAGIAVFVTGCRARGDRSDSTYADPTRQTLIDALADEERLIALYDAAKVSSLAAIRSEHDAHRNALVSALGEDAASVSPPAVPTPSRRVAPTVAELRAAEARVRSARMADALAAPASVAPLLASIAASEASHDVVLRSVRRTPRATP